MTKRSRHGLDVVKLGGSFAGSRALPAWLDTIGSAAGRVVLVPGGGPFADQVRAAQRRWRFDEATADRMALLAMEQYGLMLAALRPGLHPTDSPKAIRAALTQDAVPVWLPSAMLARARDLPATWDVTSDSLALWLAGRLGAHRVILVKSAPAPAGALTAPALAKQGLIDAAFPGLLAGVHCSAWFVGANQRKRLAAALAGQGEPGTRILPGEAC